MVPASGTGSDLVMTYPAAANTMVPASTLTIVPRRRLSTARSYGGQRASRVGTGPSGIVGHVGFGVLFVCTGNICRSPIAERLLRSRLDGVAGAAEVSLSSAGTMGLTGRPMDASSATALRELGGDSAGHVAQRLTPALVKEADLILTAESVHRSAIVRAEPMTFRRAFTIREFGRLGATLGAAGATTEQSLRERVSEVADQRGWATPAAPGADEIADPYGAPLAAARICAAQLSDAVNAVLDALGLGLAR